MSQNNNIKIDGNGNITIQDVNNSTITIDTTDATNILPQLAQLSDSILDTLSQIVEKEARVNTLFKTLLSGVISEKNIVKGSISHIQGDVIIGDNNTRIYNYYTVEAADLKVDFEQVGLEFVEYDSNQLFLREKEYRELQEALQANDLIVVTGNEGSGRAFFMRYVYAQAKTNFEQGAFLTYAEDIFTTLRGFTVAINEVEGDTFVDIARKCIKKIIGDGKTHILIINRAENISAEEIEFLRQIPIQAALSYGDAKSRIKIILSTDRPFEKFKNISLAPLSFEQIKTFTTFLSEGFGEETLEIYRKIEADIFGVNLLEKNVPRNTEKAKRHLEEIIKTIQACQSPKLAFVEKVLNLYPLSPEEEWLLLQFTVLPLKQYDSDDLALLLVKDEFVITELEIAYAAFKNELDWFDFYLQNIGTKAILFDPAVVSAHLNILESTLKEVNTAIHPIKNNLSEDQIRKYFTLDKYDQEAFMEVCADVEGGMNSAMDLFDIFEKDYHFKASDTIPDLGLVAKEIGSIKRFIEQLVDVDYDDIFVSIYETEGYNNFCYDREYVNTEKKELEEILESLAQRAWLEYNDGYYSISGSAANLLKQIFDYAASHFVDLMNATDFMYFTRPSGAGYVNLSWFNTSKSTAHFMSHAQALLIAFPMEQYNNNLLTLYDKVIDSYHDQIQYRKELEARKKYLEIVNILDKNDTSLKAEANIKLAGCYRLNGKIQPALPHGVEARRIAEGLFSVGDSFVAYIYNDLALVLKDLGDYEGARALLEKAKKSDELNFGRDHPTTAVSYSNLATVLQDLGDYEGARALLEKAKKSDELNFGRDHPTTAVSYSNLATVLQDLGDYEGARALLEKAKKSAELNFGRDHPNTAKSYSNLASVLQALGDYEGARDLLEKAKKSDELNFGRDHPTTARSYNNLALVLKDLGDYEGARELLEKAKKSDELNFGRDHPTTAKSYSNLASVLQALGDYEGARDLLEKAKKSIELNFGKDHPDTAVSYSNLATVLQALGDYEGARALLEKAKKSDELNFGRDHPTTAVSYSNLALVLQALGDYEGARVLLEKVLISAEKNYGTDHPQIAIYYSNLALVLQALGDYEGARALLEKAKKSDELNFGRDHPTTAVSYSNLALVLQALGDYEGARALLEKAKKSDELNFGRDHPNTARSYNNYACLLEEMEDYRGAFTYFKQAKKSLSGFVPMTHPNMLSLEKSISSVLEKIEQGDD